MNTFTLLVAIISSLMLSSGHAKQSKRVYTKALIEEISNSTKIEVIEHSNEWDYPLEIKNERIDNNKGPLPIIEYKKVVLTPKQKAQFLKLTKKVGPKPLTLFPACIFVEHHTIKFYKDGTLTSTMQVCFLCKLVKWDKVKEVQPNDIFKALRPFIKGIGLQPDRKWSKYLLKHKDYKSTLLAP